MHRQTFTLYILIGNRATRMVSQQKLQQTHQHTVSLEEEPRDVLSTLRLSRDVFQEDHVL